MSNIDKDEILKRTALLCNIIPGTAVLWREKVYLVTDVNDGQNIMVVNVESGKMFSTRGNAVVEPLNSTITVKSSYARHHTR